MYSPSCSVTGHPTTPSKEPYGLDQIYLPRLFGSGGGNGYEHSRENSVGGRGGYGGGRAYLNATETVRLESSSAVTAVGENGEYRYHACGGSGSGGSIVVIGREGVLGRGTITADGGGTCSSSPGNS